MWLLHILGVDNLSGRWYGFWSGFGSDISEVAVVGAVLGMFRKHNCHTKGCWRVGRHLVDGTPWCNRHHQTARADAQVSAGAGSNPATTGLTADQGPTPDPPLGRERMVPPAAPPQH